MIPRGNEPLRQARHGISDAQQVVLQRSRGDSALPVTRLPRYDQRANDSQQSADHRGGQLLPAGEKLNEVP